ncbi:discoidin domain-containing protein [Virgisporangium aurantiacum]|uniref:F5/8 type C domain-containing protein n=1 Tax=Virgisporangium aurantiacum TaxID=175570 RepID=A0A8J3YY66_9ACTN|nr:discoidin domain-containing protein [Virgisporangium aurantiacum]GIJ54184.1 hypothetical protein Vau01_017000 [Virgisporangium aurantiacum]
MPRRRFHAAFATVIVATAAVLSVPSIAHAATNLALGKSVTVSSTDGNPAPNAVDGNASTRWSSAYDDPQWIVVDLGSAQTVGSVTLRWEAAFGRAYQVQTSTDNSTWTNRFTTTAGDGGVDTATFTPAQARYVRMNGTQRATAYGYSLYEFEVYSGSAVTNVALNRPVAVSSDDGNPAANAVDGNASTRWSSAYGDPQWIVVDLGTGATIGAVTLRWEAAFGRAYRIQTSDDNTSWTDRFSTTTGDGGVDTVTLSPVSARYIRLYGTQRATQYGYSLYEFEVMGTGGGGPVDPPPAGDGPDMTGYAAVYDYRFGTAAGRFSNLAARFNPYGIAGTSVINNEWQRYQAFNGTNHRLTADRLELTAVANLGGVYNGGVSSGQITTKDTFYPRNGKRYIFKLRAKVPQNKRGAWPAFWMYARQAPNTSSEIDIVEIFDTPTQNTFDWTGYDHGEGVGSNFHSIMTNQWVWHPGFDFAADYHTYTLVWEEGRIFKWVDDYWVKGTNFTWQGSDPQVLINLAMGGSNNNNPNSASFPAVFSIDSFQVYVDCPGDAVTTSCHVPTG